MNRNPDYSPDQLELAERWRRIDSRYADSGYPEDHEAFKDWTNQIDKRELDRLLIGMYEFAETGKQHNNTERMKKEWPDTYWRYHDEAADNTVRVLEMARYLHRPMPMIVGMRQYEEHAREMDEAEYKGRGFSILPSRVRDHKRRTEWVHEAIGGSLATERGELLDRFAKSPSKRLWGTAYIWARAEGDGAQEGVAHTIPVEDLIAFSESVRAESDPVKRYALTTEVSPDGRSWFEALETFTSENNEDAKQVVLGFIVEEWRDGTPFVNAVDLGTGSGQSLAAVEEHSKQVTGIDRVPELLQIAKQKAKLRTEFVLGDIAKIPVDDGTIDLVSASGLFGSLGTEKEAEVLNEISRVLADEGVCIETSYAKDRYGLSHPEVRKVTQSAKAMLADMIVDTVSGKAGITRMSAEERSALMDRLGLEQVEWVQHPDRGPSTRVRVLMHRGAESDGFGSAPQEPPRKYRFSSSAELS